MVGIHNNILGNILRSLFLKGSYNEHNYDLLFFLKQSFLTNYLKITLSMDKLQLTGQNLG
jgi:hypothetical protein